MKNSPLAVVIVAIALTGAFFLFKTTIKPRPIPNPFPTQSRAHLPFEEFAKTLVAIPDFERKVRAQTAPADATAMGFEIAQNGMKRLDDAQLATWMELIVKLVEHLDEHTCAALSRADPAKAKALAPTFLLAIDKMSSSDIRAYFELTAKAVEAELNRADAPAFSKDSAERAMQRLVRKFSPEEQAVLMRVSLYPSTASDSSACWIVKTLFGEIMAAPAADRRMLLRLFAQPPDVRR